MIPVVVINLARSVGRRGLVKEHLGAIGVPFDFVDAVDGTRLSSDELAALDIRPVREKYGRRLVAGEIGTGASYLKVLHFIAAGRAPYVCVLEDDARLLPEAEAFLTPAALELLPAFDILQLRPASRGLRSRAMAVAVIGRVRVCAPLQPSGVTIAQIFSRSGAQRLIRHLRPMRAPVDDLFYRSPAFGCRILETRPPVVTGAKFTSSIGSDRRSDEASNRRKPRQVAAKAIGGVVRGARRWPSFVAAWGAAAAFRLRKIE